MAKKRVYAAIEFADQEVRLAVVEIFDGRNNVLRVEKVDCDGLEKGKIVNESAVVKAVQQAVRQARAALGYRIERVLLAIPGRDVKRSTQKVQVTIEDGTRNIRLFHIQQGLKKAMQKKVDETHELVNVNKISYTIHDVPVSKMPVGTETEAFTMEVDLLYVDKETLFSFVRVIEQANLEILDICLDTYALASEAAALAQSEERAQILLGLEASHTSLSLLMNGKLVSTAIIDQGFDSFIAPLKEKYHLSDQTARRLLSNLFSSNMDENRDVVIYIEQQDEQRVEITAKELAESMLPNIRNWIAEVNAASAPIIENSHAKYVIAGEGSNLPVLEDMLRGFNAPASIYRVTSIGARDGSFGTVLGMMYVFEEMNRISRDERTSVNNNELEESIESIRRYTRDEEGGFTQKLRRAMLSSED